MSIYTVRRYMTLLARAEAAEKERDEALSAMFKLDAALARVREVAERAHHGPNIKRILSILDSEEEK